MSRSLALAVAASALFMTATPAHAGDGTNLLSLAPESTQIVLVFDVADARDSKLLQKGFQMLLDAKPEAKTKLAEIGLDPMKDIDTIMFAGGGVDTFDAGDVKNMVIVIEGRLPKDKLASIPGVTSSKYAGVTIYTNADTDVAVIGDRLFFAKKGQMKAAIDVAQNKGKGKGKNVAVSKKAKGMRDAVAATDTTADLWAAVLVPAKNQKEMKAEQGMMAKTVSFGMNFTADLAISLNVVTDSVDSAAKAVSMIQSQLPQLSQGLGTLGLTKAAKSVLVSSDGAAIKISATLTEAELTTLAKTIGMFAGGGAAPSKAP